MNGILKKVLTWVILPLVIIALVYAVVRSIMEPVEFNKEKDFREDIAIQRLKDIRTLQVAFKSETGRFASTIDSLKDFYKQGNMTVLMQIGSIDDSVAVAHTEAIQKANRKITNKDLYQRYLAGDTKLVFSIENKIPVRDTLFNDRTDFRVDDLGTIPFSEGKPIEMEATVKTVSGVQVPLFEAKIPYRYLLTGLDNQLRINLDAERRDQNKYEGLQVGSIAAPNNNAGNWE